MPGLIRSVRVPALSGRHLPTSAGHDRVIPRAFFSAERGAQNLNSYCEPSKEVKNGQVYVNNRSDEDSKR